MTSTATKLNVDSLEWLLGRQAAERVCLLGNLMQTRILDHVQNLRNETYSSYSPWMSHLEKITQFSSDLHRTLSTSPSGKITSDPTVLNALQKALEDHSGVLGIGLDHDIPVQIDDLVTVNCPEFEDRYSEALTHLFKVLPWIEIIEASLVIKIFPIRSLSEQYERVGFSTHLLKGALFFMLSKEQTSFSPFELAIDIAHEIGHQVLMVYLSCDKMIDSSHSDLVYSAARRTSRGSIRSLHAAIALAYEMQTALGLLAHEGSKRYHSQLVEFLEGRLLDQAAGLASLKAVCRFTAFGQSFFEDLNAQYEFVRLALKNFSKHQ